MIVTIVSAFARFKGYASSLLLLSLAVQLVFGYVCWGVCVCFYSVNDTKMLHLFGAYFVFSVRFMWHTILGIFKEPTRKRSLTNQTTSKETNKIYAIEIVAFCLFSSSPSPATFASLSFCFIAIICSFPSFHLQLIKLQYIAANVCLCLHVKNCFI